MKKIILVLGLIFIAFSSCEKDDLTQPSKEFVELSIELYGSLPIGVYTEVGDLTFDRANFEELSYSIFISINGNEKRIDINESVNVGFFGSLYLHKINVSKQDNVKVKIINNNYPNSTYMYLRTYSKPYKLINLYFEDQNEFVKQGKYFF